jgi:broad specificity phosphatase PhoE
MAETQLWLFRPADTSWDAAQRLRGKVDLPATEESLAELRQRVARLADPDLGLLEGLSLAEFERRFESRHAEWLASPLTVIPPEGEAMADARARILDALAEILVQRAGQRVGIVLHSIALAIVRDALARGDGSRLWERVEGRSWCTQYVLPADAGVLLGD